MKQITVDIWDYPHVYKCITTNGYVNRAGECVMGRGVALQAKQRYPEIATWLGNKIKRSGNMCYVYDVAKIITFPTKHHWSLSADIELIRESCRQLMHIINMRDIACVLLPKPGCSNGKLHWEDVRPVIEHLLDDRVFVVDRK